MNPKTPREHFVGPFVCPMCNFRVYEPVTVTNRDRTLLTGIFRCAKCHFAFADPTKHQTERKRRQ
jgi:ribosomal protein L37AE/L43A